MYCFSFLSTARFSPCTNSPKKFTHLDPEPLAGLQRPRAREDVGAVVGDVVGVEVLQVEVERFASAAPGTGTVVCRSRRPCSSRTPLCCRHLDRCWTAAPVKHLFGVARQTVRRRRRPSVEVTQVIIIGGGPISTYVMGLGRRLIRYRFRR